MVGKCGWGGTRTRSPRWPNGLAVPFTMVGPYQPRAESYATAAAPATETAIAEAERQLRIGEPPRCTDAALRLWVVTAIGSRTKVDKPRRFRISPKI